MRRSLGVLASLVAVSVAHAGGAPREGMRLSDLARELAATPGAFDALVAKLGGGELPLSEDRRAALRKAVASGDYAALDRQPRLTLAQLGAVVEAASLKAGPTKAPERVERVERLGIPAGGEAPEAKAKDLGFGVTMGGPMDPDLEAKYPDSKRLAEVLERLSLGGFTVRYAGKSITTVDGLVSALRETGHTVTVEDRKRVANFFDLAHDGKSVAAPLWIETDKGAMPAPHGELVIHVSGPRVNADVSFFNGIDTSGGGTSGVRFRPWKSRGGEWWVGGNTTSRYDGDEAVEAVRLMGAFHKAAWEKVAEHGLAFGGYFKLGVCTTAGAVVEKALRGKTTAWPLTHDRSLFRGDGEIDRLVRGLPSDLRGRSSVERMRASSPWSDPARSPFAEVRSTLGPSRGIADGLELK